MTPEGHPVHVLTRMKAFVVGANKHLVCNAITGEIIVMSDAGMRILTALRNGEPQSCPPQLLDELMRKRFVFMSGDEEEQAFAELCRSSRAEFQRNAPRQYTFIINTHCNLRCPYCFEEAYNARAQTLSAGQIDAAFRVIDRYSARPNAQPPGFEIFGGEPLLPGSRPVLEHLMRCISERNGQASVQTNGYFLSDHIDLFVKYRDSINQIQVTLDGPKDIHDRRRVRKGGRPTFDRIVVGLNALAKQDLALRINVRMNVDRKNVDQLARMAEIYEQNGWASDSRFTFIAAPVDNRCGALKDIGDLLGWHELFDRVLPLSSDSGAGPFDISVFKIAGYFRYYLRATQDTASRLGKASLQFIPKVLYCEAAALKLFVFHPDGRIYPCPETVGAESLAVGTYNPGFRLDRRRARQWYQHTILAKERCRSCEISTFCGGGCVLAALTHNGTMAEPLCENAGEILESYFGQITRAQ